MDARALGSQARASRLRVLSGALALALPALLALAAAGCRTSQPRSVEIPLLYEYERRPEAVYGSYPLLLSGYEYRPRTDEMRTKVLWPFYGYTREGRESEHRLLGMPFYQEKIDHRGFVDWDITAWLFFAGHSVDEGGYFTLLPFGGTLKGELGKDFVFWVLPPLYAYMVDQGGRERQDAFYSHHILFPFINFVYGGGRTGWRFLPFYGHYERYDVDGRQSFERTYVLWPLFSYLESSMNSLQGGTTLWFLFPFVGHQEGPKTSQWTVLWPLFRYWENRGSTSGGPAWELRAPFPFFIYAKRRYGSRFDVWPLFGIKDRMVPIDSRPGAYDRYHRHFVLWPLWRYERHETDLVDSRKWFLVPFYWRYHTVNKEEGTEKHEVKIWPLFRYKRWPDGRTTVNVLSPLWFNDPEGAFERIYGPLFRVYENRHDPDGTERTSVLWGLYQGREDGQQGGFTLHPFLFWHDATHDESFREVGVLFGLFQYIRRGERKALRFFWLPEWPSWGGEDEPEDD